MLIAVLQSKTSSNIKIPMSKIRPGTLWQQSEENTEKRSEWNLIILIFIHFSIFLAPI